MVIVLRYCMDVYGMVLESVPQRTTERAPAHDAGRQCAYGLQERGGLLPHVMRVALCFPWTILHVVISKAA